MMEERVKKELMKEEQTPFHSRLLQHCKSLVDLSRKEMCKYYEDWDKFDDVYRGVKAKDKEDKLAENRGEPIKSVMPVTKAQIDTFVAFAFAVFFQREYFFELTPFGNDNTKAAKTGEALLNRDLEMSNFWGVMWQFLLDIGKFGVGVMKETWEEEYQIVTEKVDPKRFEIFGVSIPVGFGSEKQVRKTKFQGNRVRSVSPYRFYPDPRYPLTDIQRGEFIASEDEYAFTELKRMEADGMVSGVKHISAYNANNMAELRKFSRFGFVDFGGENTQTTIASKGGSVIVTEVIVSLIPSEWDLADGDKLEEMDRPQKYVVWYANDNRVIRVEPFRYAHDEYPYSVGQLGPDMHHLISQGWGEVLDKLQELITWFINSHVTSVRKVIFNRLVVDPEGVEMDDLKNRAPVIRLKPGMARSGVERWVKQLDLQDVTANHVQDARVLHEMVQIATGISENAMGQFHGGRRSALEARNVNSSVAARLKTILTVIYYAALQPMGRRMLSNLREGLSAETFVRLFGVATSPNEFLDFAKVTSADLVGDYDFELFDGTLPTEKVSQAATLQEALGAIAAQPELAVVTGLDIKKLFFELMELRGIRHPEQFAMGFEEQVQNLKMIAAVQQLIKGPPQEQEGPNDEEGGGDDSGGAPQGS